jgi:hypothetical protein
MIDGGRLPTHEGIDRQTLRFCGDRHAQIRAHEAIRIDLTDRRQDSYRVISEEFMEPPWRGTEVVGVVA